CALTAPQGSVNGAGVAYGVVPWMLWMWNQACGGLPVDFHAAVARTAGSSLMSPAASKPLLSSDPEVAPLTLTSSMIAAPLPPDENPPPSSSDPRFVLTRNTRRILPGNTPPTMLLTWAAERLNVPEEPGALTPCLVASSISVFLSTTSVNQRRCTSKI